MNRPFASGVRLLTAVGLFALIASPPDVRSAREITITKTSGHPLALQPLAGSSGKTASNIVQSDLNKTGVFNFSPPGQGVFVASGNSSGGRIDGTLTAPDGRQIFSRTYAGKTLTSNAHRFADDIVFAITGKPGVASGTIAFISDKSGHKEIYLCDYDGKNIRKVTSDRALSVSPSISSDGSYLAYTGYKSGYADVYLVDLLSGSRRRIINSPGTNSGAAISPDGRRIALTMSYTGNTELYITGVSGGRGKRLTRTRGVEASPTWSPDGRELIYTSDESGRPQLYRSGSRGGKGKRLKVGYGHCTEPDWSPDGSRLAFNTLRNGRQVIAVYEFKNGKTRVVSSGGSAENPCWGADSRHLAFTRSRRLVVLNVDSDRGATIVSGMGQISEPSWTR